MGTLSEALSAFALVSPPPVERLGRVDHVGVKVADLAAAQAEAQALGLRVRRVSEHPEVGLRIAFVDGASLGTVELLEVVSPQSPLAGDACGLHHVAYCIGGLRAAFETARQDARLTFLGGVRRGAQGHEIATFRVKAAPVPAFELVESGGDT